MHRRPLMFVAPETRRLIQQLVTPKSSHGNSSELQEASILPLNHTILPFPIICRGWLQWRRRHGERSHNHIHYPSKGNRNTASTIASRKLNL